jgi:hypothetical protein
MTPDRSDARVELASILSTALVGSGKPCQAVYAYQPATFNGQSPVVTVSSAGAHRPSFTHQGNQATFSYYIHVFVLYSDADSGWTESDCETRLDLIEKTILETLIANRIREGHWNLLHQDEPSNAVSVKISGLEYRAEVITVIAEVYA